MGVEPTQQRVAPLTGFEARPTHQDRFPSMASVVIVLQATKAVDVQRTGFDQVAMECF